MNSRTQPQSEDWSPDGYSDPIEYEPRPRHVTLVAIITAVALLPITVGPIRSGGVEAVLALLQLGLAFGSPVVGVPVLGLITAVLWLLVLTPVHEGLNYLPGLVFGLNPVYGVQDRLLPTPFVIHHTTGITLGENLVTMLAPVTVIGIASAVVMWTSSGIVAGLAAFVLLSNTVSSAQDLSHVVRLVQMPEGTLFANFESADGYDTEFTNPETDE
jgi:hypothetical protein